MLESPTLRNADYQARRDRFIQERRSIRLSIPAPGLDDDEISVEKSTPTLNDDEALVPQPSDRKASDATQANNDDELLLTPKQNAEGDRVCDLKDIVTAPPIPDLSPGRSRAHCRRPSTGSVSDSAKLQELRASKTERESQLRQLITDSPIAHGPQKVDKPPLVEPSVYVDMKEELVHAYEVIELQKQHLQGLPSTDSNGSTIDKVAELEAKIRQMEQDRAYRELEIQRRMTEKSHQYKITIDHWKREAQRWNDRFDSAWDDHEQIIKELKLEKKQQEQRAQKAEKDLAAFMRASDETLLELLRTKARIHDLEEQLGLEDELRYKSKAVSDRVDINPVETKEEEPSGDEECIETQDDNDERHRLQAAFIADAMKKSTPRFFPWGIAR